MEKIIDITQNLLQNQARNKRNFICGQILFVAWDILFLIFMLTHSMINAVFIYNTFLLLMVNYLAISNIKKITMFNRAIQYHVIPKIINMHDFDSTNNWLNQNKRLFPKNRIRRLFANKLNYSVWGCIETNDIFQVVIIDLSKKNTLLVLTIEKNDLSAYTESDFLIKLIKRIPKKKKFNELWFKKYFFSHLTFYIYE